MTHEEQRERLAKATTMLIMISLDALLPYGTSERLEKIVAAALLSAERGVWRKVRAYHTMRLAVADTSRCAEALAGNVVAEANEDGAIAELRGLEMWINEQSAPQPVHVDDSGGSERA